jgi:hypothetical protein
MSDFTPSAHDSLSLNELLKAAANGIDVEEMWQYISTNPHVIQEIARSANMYREYIATGFMHEDIMLAKKIGYPIDKAAQKARRYITLLKDVGATIRPIDQRTPLWEWIDAQMAHHHASYIPLTREEFVNTWCELADLNVGHLIGPYIQVRRKSNNISHAELIDLIRRLISRGERYHLHHTIRYTYMSLRRKGWSPREAEEMLGFYPSDVKYIIEARRRGLQHDDLMTISAHSRASLAKIACALRNPALRPDDLMLVVLYESSLEKGKRHEWGAALIINPLTSYLHARKKGLAHQEAFDELIAKVSRHTKK